MADIEIRRKKKFDGDEDPIVIAQRFLNIFHQLHIFNDEKKNDFNNMILKQPPVVLSMLNTLPGGGLLLDYVEDLEQKAGITNSRTNNNIEPSSLSNIDEEVSRAKILATALAEAQVQANAKMQANAVNISPQAAPQIFSAPSKLEIGADFSNGLAQAIAKAIENTNNQHKDDIKGFVQTLGKTQLEIINILQQDNNERKKETLDLTRMLSESQKQIAQAISEKPSLTTVPSITSAVEKENHADLLEFLKSSQQQTNQILLAINEKQTAAPSVAPVVEKENHADLSEFLKASQQQTNQILLAFEKNRGISGEDLSKFAQLSQQQLHQAMLAINENRRADTMEIANMMKESQLEVAKMLIQSNSHSNNNNAQANNIQINNNSDTSMQQLMNLVEGLAKIQTNNITHAMSPKISFDMSGLENVLSQLIKSQSQLYKELSMTQNKELATIISLALKENQKISSNNIIMAIEKLPKATQIVERVVNVAAAPAYTETETQQSQDIEDSETDENSEEFEEQDATAIAESTPKKKKKKKKKKNREEEIINTEPETTSDEELVAEAAFFEARNQIDEMFEKIEMADDLDQYIYVEAPVESPEIVEEQHEESNEEFVIDDWLDNEPEINVQEETTASVETQDIEVQNIEIPEIEVSDNTDIIEDFDFSQFDTPVAIDDKAAEDWGWNTPTEEPITPEPETTQKSEWEYEEETLAMASDADADGEGEEWEWEYEEENVDGQANAEEQDWEWEYEEVLDDSTDSSISTEEPAYKFAAPIENANLIDENSPIYSRELYFQEDVYNNKDTNYDLGIALPLESNIMIKNLEEKDVNDDPYKNYEVKE